MNKHRRIFKKKAKIYPKEWETTVVDEIPEKRLVSGIHKEILQLGSKTQLT
jgi:hypothetical protein